MDAPRSSDELVDRRVDATDVDATEDQFVDDAFAELNRDFDDVDEANVSDDDDDDDEDRVRKCSSTSLHSNPVFSMKRPSIDVPFALKRPSVDIPFSAPPAVLEKLACPITLPPTIPEDVPFAAPPAAPVEDAPAVPEDAAAITAAASPFEAHETSSCPFKELPDHEALSSLKTLPEFKDGCVFKEAADMKEVVGRMEAMARSSETFDAALRSIVEEANRPSKDVADEWVEVVEMVKTEGVRICESLDRARWDLRLQAEETLRRLAADEEAAVVVAGTPTTPTRDLSDALKEDTQEAHRRAETCEFMHAFMRGSVTKRLYREFLAAMYFVYEAMEEEMEKNEENEVLQTIHFPAELNRLDAIEEDLKFYYGDDWRDEYVVSQGCKNYVGRIRELGRSEPELLVAHHYTRYLGDISGGQTLKKKAQKAWGLDGDPDENRGIAFYYFPHVPDPNNFKRMYRARLNIIGEDAALAERIVRESNRVYDFNTDIFKEMDDRAKEIDGFSNVKPSEFREAASKTSTLSTSGELKLRKPICPVMSGKVPLDETREMWNPHAVAKDSPSQCPFDGVGTKFLRGLVQIAEPVFMMALASLMTLVLHASDVI